jgi:hypothetical protein
MVSRNPDTTISPLIQPPELVTLETRVRLPAGENTFFAPAGESDSVSSASIGQSACEDNSPASRHLVHGLLTLIYGFDCLPEAVLLCFFACRLVIKNV